MSYFSFHLPDKYKVLIPIDASVAVVQGAVIFGQKPHVIDSGIMRTTYGLDTNHPFDPNVHHEDKKHVVEGIPWCKDCFDVLVKEEDVVHVGETKRFSNYQPIEKSQTGVSFRFFTSSSAAAKYITDAAVGSSIGQVVVKSPEIWKGSDRRLDICVHFGGTEIKVTAIDMTIGNTATAYLDFLCKH